MGLLQELNLSGTCYIQSYKGKKAIFLAKGKSRQPPYFYTSSPTLP